MPPPKPQVQQDATLVYNYHKMHMTPSPSSAIFCLCSLDTRIATHAASLYLTGLGPYLIFSGGSGALTASRFTKPEAEVFADIARGMGVPESALIIEPNATNTGENVRFTYELLKQRGLEGRFTKLILVQKPYMERRTYATFRKQWPDAGTEFSVTSPEMEFEKYPDEENPRELVINVMVGDLVRIREYPKRGFQVEMEIPDEVWEAKDRLVAAGFDKHLP